jgi:hypothetical protein
MENCAVSGLINGITAYIIWFWWFFDAECDLIPILQRSCRASQFRRQEDNKGTSTAGISRQHGQADSEDNSGGICSHPAGRTSHNGLWDQSSQSLKVTDINTVKVKTTSPFDHIESQFHPSSILELGDV